MSYSGNEGQDISLTTAAAWTKNYRDSVSTGTVIAHYYGGTPISGILAQTGCVGIRMYYAIDDSGNPQLVLTGVDSNGNDLYNGKLVDRGVCCPTGCSSANPLNTTTS